MNAGDDDVDPMEGIAETIEEAKVIGRMPEPREDWVSLLMTNADRSLKGNLENCMVVFRHAPAFAGKIGRDTRSGRLIAIAETPAGPTGPWTDDYTTAATAWIQRAHIPVRLVDVAHAVQAVASTVPVDELGDWLRSLADKWDGIERIGSWLSDYCSAVDSPANSLMGSKFLIGAAARALTPGCRMDNVLVLEGEQGVGKSTVIKILGGDHCGENLPDLHSRDAMQIVNSKWIIELSELAAMRRSDIEQVKSFVTRTEDTYVPKYQRHPISRKRSSVLIGNINPDENGYLVDTTGNRRFWPVSVGELFLDNLRRDREQLFAEAVFCFNRGDPWWIENSEQRDLLSGLQEERMETDEWEAIISRFIDEEPVWDDARHQSWHARPQALSTTTQTEIATLALGMQPKELNRTAQVRIGYAMKKLGFVKKRNSIGGRRSYTYSKPELG